MPFTHDRHVKDFVHDYVDTVGSRSEAPAKFHYWAAVAAISGALRRRCYIDHVTFKWVPNWFIIFVGPPGVVRKSTTCDVALDVLQQVEGINFGPDCTTWEQLVSELAKAQDIYATGDDTSFMEQNYEACCAMTLGLSEFGSFFDPKNLALVNVMTELWDGSELEWKKATKTQGSDHIVSPFLNMIACTTPAWMLMNFKGFAGWGFSARCIFVYATEPARLIAYPAKVWGHNAKAWKHPFVETLRHIAEMQGEYVLSPEADAFGERWYIATAEKCKQLARDPLASVWIADFLARKQVHVHKLALALAAGRRDELIITLEDLVEAIDKLDEVERELGSIFGKQAVNQAQFELASALWKDIEDAMQQYGRVKEGHIYKYTATRLPYHKAQEYVENLLRGDILRREIDIETGATWLVRGPGNLSDTLEVVGE